MVDIPLNKLIQYYKTDICPHNKFKLYSIQWIKIIVKKFYLAANVSEGQWADFFGTFYEPF